MTAKKELILNPDWCKGCGICAAFCPKGALEIVNEKVRRVENAECILCGECASACGNGVLGYGFGGGRNTR